MQESKALGHVSNNLNDDFTTSIATVSRSEAHHNTGSCPVITAPITVVIPVLECQMCEGNRMQHCMRSTKRLTRMTKP